MDCDDAFEDMLVVGQTLGTLYSLNESFSIVTRRMEHGEAARYDRLVWRQRGCIRVHGIG